MARIKILPEILSNKIAAGEVVERPASVVKELVENALDAGSTKIIVDIEKGGRSLIRVSDNGIGMSHDDALLSLERYATSKIAKDTDLFAINTLGFRGEALPSIASVSRFQMISRNKDSDSGVDIYVEGGKIKKVSETGAPIGTMIAIKQLFYNIPARRKFMKTINTEMGHISDTLANIAIGRPKVRFTLNHNGKQVKNWIAVSEHLDRAADILGKDAKKELRHINYTDNTVTISGWVTAPRYARSTSRGINIYVNDRFVKDKTVQHAIFQGYKGRLVKGQYPAAIIFLKVPYDEVDVNVHPTKHEVRFARQHEIHGAIKNTISNALGKADREETWTRPVQKPVPVFESEVKPEFKKNIPLASENSEPKAVTANAFTSGPASVSEPDSIPEPFKEIEEVAETLSVFKTEAPQIIPEELPQERLPEMPIELSKKETVVQQALFEESRFSNLNIIGQSHNTYILCESGDGVILIDQHAAHERVLYEKLKSRSDNARVSVQNLLIPETIELNFRESDILEKLTPDLEKSGMEIESFGGNTYVIKSVPTILEGKAAAPLIMEIIDKALEIGVVSNLDKAREESLMIMACHGAIRANQKLSFEEIKGLLSQMEQCEDPFHCPHGRPTWVEWTKRDIEKAFKRIV
ncbi:MAG: DNA mismatch repair endonuclease MutL [Desulfobacterales bacterium]|nr:DNA mismatch repair endonuclease MutL [Desulfobacterales bacterium]